MSGYLGRMLRAAARTEPRLRPLAGSILGDRGGVLTLAGDAWPVETAKAGDEQEFAETEQTVVSRRPSGRNVKAHPEEPMSYLENYEPLHQRTRGREMYSPNSAAGDLRADVDAVGEQNLMRRVERQGEELRTAVRPDTVKETPADRVTRDAANLREAAQPRDELISQRAAQPPGELISQRAAQPIVTPLEPVRPLRRQSGPLHQAPRNAATETPDVHVHIGRIEVLAVQPPAPSAPAPRRPRTTSLADYMAGRNGR